MRILSARVAHARRDTDSDQVRAVVHILVERSPGAGPERAEIPVSAPAHAQDAAPLRHRLIAAAKLAYAAGLRLGAARRAA